MPGILRVRVQAQVCQLNFRAQILRTKLNGVQQRVVCILGVVQPKQGERQTVICFPRLRILLDGVPVIDGRVVKLARVEKLISAGKVLACAPATSRRKKRRDHARGSPRFDRPTGLDQWNFKARWKPHGQSPGNSD